MLRLSTGWRLLSRALPTMYTARLYGTPAGGGGAKQGRRAGLAVLEAPRLPHPLPPPPAYPLYQGRPDSHRGAHYLHHYHPHLAPPPLAQHYHTSAASCGGGAAPGPKKKTWNFIHEKMSYDTFFTMKRLIERSRRADEVLRWVAQNPAKVSHNHYPVALQRIGQLLHGEGGEARRVLEQPDFQTLCGAIVRDTGKLDNFSIVNCLYAVAALGLPSDSQVVQVLEAESQSRLNQFNQKDVSMVFSSSMKLHPGIQHPLTEACLAGLEKNLERERHPQTLFLLLSYYRLKWRSLQDPGTGSPQNPEQLLINRKILRLVKHTLSSVSTVRDQEMALLDEMLAVCVREASNKSLEVIFSSHLFYQNRQEKFISSLADELPKKVESVTPYTMALISKYMARHRLRETRLLDTIADFLVKKAEYLDSKVIQKLVFPFSRMSYRPSNQQQFFSRLEEAVQLKALGSPLATVNILMSLFQLGHFPGLVLHRVFSPAFIANVTNSPYALIVRRYLSLLDAAVELEYRDYTGPRLQDAHKVLMFDHALTADEVNRKYSYKGLVAEALRQLLGEQNYKQDEVLAPGYNTDFVLWLDASGRVLPIASLPGPVDVTSSRVTATTKPSEDAVAAVTSDLQKFSPFAASEEAPEPQRDEDGDVETRSFLPPHVTAATTGRPPDYSPYYVPEFYPVLTEEPSVESQDSSTLSSPPSDSLPPPAAPPPHSLIQFSIGKILEEEAASGVRGSDFYRAADAGPSPPPQLHHADLPEPEPPLTDQRQVRRVIVSVNDKWHYCHNSEVLVGSRAMRDRHLRLLGYVILQLPYHELEKLNGIEEVKQYLHQKLLELQR